MATYSVDNQITFTNQWFRTWSDFQKDDFINIIAQKINPGQYINGIVNGLNNIDTSGRPPSLFSCQIKLFKEWWDTWNETDREKCINQLKDGDPKFWAEVEKELSGTRKKVEDDFFTVTITAATTTVAPIVVINTPTVEIAEAEELEVIEDTDLEAEVNMNNGTSVSPTIISEEGAVV